MLGKSDKGLNNQPNWIFIKESRLLGKARERKPSHQNDSIKLKKSMQQNVLELENRVRNENLLPFARTDLNETSFALLQLLTASFPVYYIVISNVLAVLVNQ